MTSISTFDRDRGRLAFLYDSYWGGDRYRMPSSPTMGRAVLTQWRQALGDGGVPTGAYARVAVGTYQSYLVPHPGEAPEAFVERMSLASYVNLCAPIVDAYVDAVTGPVSRDLGALGPYLARLDGRGRAWAEYVEEVGRWAAVYGYCATVLDVPRENPSTSRADEERRGVGLRATLVHPSAFAWLSVDDDGELEEFAFADAAYFMPETGTQTVRFWVYTRTTWALFETTVILAAGLASVRPSLSGLTPVRSGALARPGRVPVVFAYFRQDTSSATPRGVPLIGDAADLTRQIFNTLSCVEEIHRKTAFPFLAIPEQAQGGALDPATRVQVGPDQALGYSSATGAPAWVQPSSESTKELRDHAMFLGMLALRTTGLEVSSSDASPDASGEALKVRSRDFDSRCARFARGLAAFEREVLALAASMLALRDDAQVTYPKRFTLPSPADDLARAILLDQTFGATLGPAGRTAATRAAVDAALALSDEQLAAIMNELQTPAGARALVTASDVAAESLLSIVTQVATRTIPRETGVALITSAFPIDSAAADELMGDVGRTFFAVSVAGVP